MGDSELARYQDALMDLLAGEDLGRGGRLRVLREDPAFGPFAEYVAGFEPAMVDYLAAVGRKWGKRRE